MRKKVTLLFVFAVLSAIFMVGLDSTFAGYFGFYYNNKTYETPAMYKLTQRLILAKPTRLFLANSGMETGYGFFAPNVSSHFVLHFELMDSEGEVIKQRFFPAFQQKESRMRFTTVFNMFLDKLEKEEDSSDYQRYLDIVIEQLALRMKTEIPEARAIRTQLYLYHYPTLKEFREGFLNEQLILISEYNN